MGCNRSLLSMTSLFSGGSIQQTGRTTNSKPLAGHNRHSRGFVCWNSSRRFGSVQRPPFGAKLGFFKGQDCFRHVLATRARYFEPKASSKGRGFVRLSQFDLAGPRIRDICMSGRNTGRHSISDLGSGSSELGTRNSELGIRKWNLGAENSEPANQGM